MLENRKISAMASLVSARSESELLAMLKEAGGTLGFDKVLFGIELRLPVVGAIQHIASGYPVAYQELYRQRAFIERDPTVAHCLNQTAPLEWSEHLYNEHSHELMEESRAHGLGHGISVPVRENAQIVGMLSLGRDKPFESQAEREHVMAEAIVLASCVHMACARLIVPDLMAQRRPRLSPREKECFQLVAAGKSNWDMGCILGISEAAVAFHVKNLLKKLQVSSRAQAVAIGVVLGMIK